MKNIGNWFLLLNKRLYNKVTFLLILVLMITMNLLQMRAEKKKVQVSR